MAFLLESLQTGSNIWSSLDGAIVAVLQHSFSKRVMHAPPPLNFQGLLLIRQVITLRWLPRNYPTVFVSWKIDWLSDIPVVWYTVPIVWLHRLCQFTLPRFSGWIKQVVITHKSCEKLEAQFMNYTWGWCYHTFSYATNELHCYTYNTIGFGIKSWMWPQINGWLERECDLEKWGVWLVCNGSSLLQQSSEFTVTQFALIDLNACDSSVLLVMWCDVFAFLKWEKHAYT